ncbi:MAG TPA: adenosylhomocysteinase [Acidimicrobiia bacterium]|nr:adenosylhomocysteinase [Acidimicrobiia bacterium]
MIDRQYGRGMIEFARQFMPALEAARQVVAANGRLEGRRVGIALTLEPKTACLVEAVSSLGAEVAVFGSGHSTKGQVVEALAEVGVSVFAREGADRDEVDGLRSAFIDTRPEFLSDDGASIVRRIHTERIDVLAALQGVAEETTSGVRPLRVMEAQGALRVPCVAVNDARVKLLFDNRYGTGQSVVMATLDATNTQMPGKEVVVVGYGKVGRGLAAVAQGLGARVTVTEIDPVEALAAYHDGHRVMPLAAAVASADVVFTATGIGHSLTAEHITLMPDGAIVAVGGAGPPEFDPSLGPELVWGAEVRPHVRALETDRGTTVFLIADGFCANTSAGEGNPIEIMDLSLALQMRALDYLAAGELEVGVHLLPRSIEEEVAVSQLAAVGVEIDHPTPAQIEAAGTW